MILKLEGKEYKVYWSHFSDRFDQCGSCGHKHEIPRWTECHIEALDGALVAEGDADCSRKDQYVKKIGRMRSFVKAAENLVDHTMNDMGYNSLNIADRKVKRSALMKEVFSQYQGFCKPRVNAQLQSETTDVKKELLDSNGISYSATQVS